MRARALFAAISVAFGFACVGACSFGVDVDGLFGEGPVDGAAPTDALAQDASPDAAIPSIPVAQIAAGDDFACGRRVDGSVMCWGRDGDEHRLGGGSTISSSAPVLVKEITDAADLAVGRRHACVVRASGAVACWGDNESRQIGDGTTDDAPTPKAVVNLEGAVQVALGDTFSCARKNDGSVQCWGDNAEGQLGDGTTTPRAQPGPVTGLAGAKQIVAAASTACALVESGDVFCWGNNSSGQTGATPPDDARAPVKVAGLANIVALGAGSSAGHLCAVAQAGNVECWGDGDFGNLGNADDDDSSTPVPVVSVNDAVGVVTGSGYSCAWRKSGEASCWGKNDWRQLGVGDATPPDSVSSPLPVTGLQGVTQIAAGNRFACALFGDGGHVSCWGSNVAGALGRGTPIASEAPRKIATGPIETLGLGHHHACAVDAKGGLACWGRNEYRELRVSTFLATGTPTPVPDVTGVTAAGGGDLSTCAVVAGGEVRCWGRNDVGNLGNGSTTYIQGTPVSFQAGGPVVAVGGGNRFNCARLESGEVACAGSASSGRLGHSGSDTSTPVLVVADPGDPDAGPTNLGGVTKLSVGFDHSCAVHGGTVSCWGDNGNGELGRPKGGTSSTPLDVALPEKATDVAAGASHTCALLEDGTLRCWGANGHGQLTGGGEDGPDLRTPDLGGKKATAVAAGNDHSCALASDGAVFCWGRGELGQLGNGVRADATSPAQVTGLPKATAIFADEHYTCALVEDGSGYCWGNNEFGQLGDGTVMTTGTPGAVAGY